MLLSPPTRFLPYVAPCMCVLCDQAADADMLSEVDLMVSVRWCWRAHHTAHLVRFAVLGGTRELADASGGGHGPLSAAAGRRVASGPNLSRDALFAWAGGVRASRAALSHPWTRLVAAAC